MKQVHRLHWGSGAKISPERGLPPNGDIGFQGLSPVEKNRYTRDQLWAWAPTVRETTGFVGPGCPRSPNFQILYSREHSCTNPPPSTAMLDSPLRARLGQGALRDLAGRARGLHQ